MSDSKDSNSAATSPGDSQDTTRSDIAATISACKDFDAKWKEFQRRFDEALVAGLNGLAGAFAGGGLSSDAAKLTAEERRAVFEGKPPSLELIGKGLSSGKYKNIVVCAGAGLSTSAGTNSFSNPQLK
jgi:hypothetical protein